MAIFHCPIQIIKRSIGKSAVAAAAYRSGERLTNEWDGMTHDYTHKGGIVHTEIMLPSHAPPEFQDRSTLWNSVEQIEKSSDAQLAREIEVALPVELSPAQQLALVRAFVKDNFVDAGMCADFAIHDKGTGNPHAHILLTIRPLRPDGKWGPKCRKVYDLDSQHRFAKRGSNRISAKPFRCPYKSKIRATTRTVTCSARKTATLMSHGPTRTCSSAASGRPVSRTLTSTR